MTIKTPTIHFQIINTCLIFILFLVVISSLSHQALPLLSWINYCLYFLMFLQCIFIFRKETINRDIFLNIGLLCFFYSTSFINVFIGDVNEFGNGYLSFYVFEYRTIFLSFLLGLSVVYVCVKYILFEFRTKLLYPITLLIITPVFLWCFFPFLQDYNYLLSLPTDAELYKRILLFTFFSFSAVCIYGFYLYKNEKSLGQHINSLMVCFFIMTLLEMVDIFGNLYEIKLFSFSQYILLVILSFFIITLSQKLNYIYSDFGQFYDQLVVSGNNYGVPIKHRKNAFLITFMRLFKAYFHHRKNALGLVALVFIIFINYLQISNYIKLNLAVAFIGFLILSYYLLALYRKRTNSGNLLSIGQYSDY